MNKRQWMTALALSGLLAAPALAFEVKPGEWLREVKGADGEKIDERKICISPQQAQNHFQLSGMVNRDSARCKTTSSSQSGGVVTFERACEARKGSKVEGKGTAREISPNEIQTEMTVTTQISSQPQPVITVHKGTIKKISDSEVAGNSTVTGGWTKDADQSTVHYKYLGPVCGKDAEPLKD